MVFCGIYMKITMCQIERVSLKEMAGYVFMVLLSSCTNEVEDELCASLLGASIDNENKTTLFCFASVRRCVFWRLFVVSMTS